MMHRVRIHPPSLPATDGSNFTILFEPFMAEAAVARKQGFLLSLHHYAGCDMPITPLRWV